MISPVNAAKTLAEKLNVEKEALTKAGHSDERVKLMAEKAELEDRKILAANRERLLTRRQLLITDAAHVAALAEVQTRGITRQRHEPALGVGPDTIALSYPCGVRGSPSSHVLAQDAVIRTFSQGDLLKSQRA
jgi:hypothetical protein